MGPYAVSSTRIYCRTYSRISRFGFRLSRKSSRTGSSPEILIVSLLLNGTDADDEHRKKQEESDSRSKRGLDKANAPAPELMAVRWYKYKVDVPRDGDVLEGLYRYDVGLQ